ncbi:MarR family transcriptional regulator [bacterium]|nr:MarR family transcriptional regulator [candidate division CSSED10-310 bacterium]
MTEPRNLAEKRAFIEEVGIIYEQMGMYRMAGRIIGWLLICDPPHQTAKELATILAASKGSISTIVRWLDDSGLIERLGIPGQRSTCYRIKPGAWVEIAKAKTAFHKPLKELADRGLKLLSDKPPEIRDRLDEMRALQAFFEKEIPLLLSRFQREYRERHMPDR